MKINYLAVDFDGTLCEHDFPEIGAAKKDVIKIVKYLQRDGTKLILHTCREDTAEREYLKDALRWCASNGLMFDAINENPWVGFGREKMYADVYLDDRALNVRDVESLL